MRFEPKLSGDAAALARTHRATLEELPSTFQVSILIELEKWTALFEAERAYQRALLGHLASMPPAGRRTLFAALGQVEREAGCDRIRAPQPARYQDEAQAALRAARLLTRWRREVQAVFDAVQPVLDRQLHPADGPRRLIVQMYASGIGVKTERMWSRFDGSGSRVPLRREGIHGAGAFLRAVFGRDRTLFAGLRARDGASHLDAWIIESGAALHAHAEQAGATGAARSHTGLSYERLRAYRDELTQALYRKIQAGVESPQAFAAYARSLRIAPPPDALLDDGEAMTAFVRDTFLTGNGTLFVNNTFVEWAAVQALRRAQPRLLVARYGVRDRMKPFSSLLLFSQPRATDQIPDIEDPTGSFIDVEQLAYYVWLNAEKSAAYRQRTLHLFLADSVDTMLAIRAGDSRAPAVLPEASLADVGATMAVWLGVPPPDAQGRPIEALLG
jgi:hypothetical protein